VRNFSGTFKNQSRFEMLKKGELFQPLRRLTLEEEFAVEDSQSHLRAKADKYRVFARWLSDRETAQRILTLTNELEQRASAMEKPSEEDIRKRAHELWEHAGKPENRDEEFWHLAEQELRNADKSSPLRTPDNL
jgi:Protein of unknown function (DUF2934)